MDFPEKVKWSNIEKFYFQEVQENSEREIKSWWGNVAACTLVYISFYANVLNLPN